MDNRSEKKNPAQKSKEKPRVELFEPKKETTQFSDDKKKKKKKKNKKKNKWARFINLMVLFLIGLGLGSPKDITLRGL